MPKRSTATVREQPVAAVASASGTFHVRSETFTLDTHARLEIQDLTERVMAIVRALEVKEGLAHVFSMHTTCTLVINEHQKALLEDMTAYLQAAVDAKASWLHNDPRLSDCDRQNADAHLRALLLGHSVTLQVHAGEVVLGQWQRILCAELDGPRTRTIRVSVMGIS
jgi:secondary thiamine-phosphate synthase enzyme